MDGNTFIGRTRELTYLQGMLQQDSVRDLAVQVFYIHGATGFGKSVFLKKLSEYLKILDNAYVSYIPQPFDQLIDEQELVISILKTFKSSSTILSQLVNELITGLSEKRGPAEAATFLSNFKAAFHKKIVNNVRSSKMKILFFIDDFIDWHNVAKDFFKKFFIDGLYEYKAKIDIRYVMTGATRINLYEYFVKSRERIEEMNLPPFGLIEVEKLLNENKVPIDLACSWIKQTEGVPGRLSDKIEEYLNPSGEIKDNDPLKNITAHFTEKQKLWLLWAALMPESIIEGLSIFCGDYEAKLAFNWLSRQKSITWVKNFRPWTLDKSFAKKILEWFRGMNTAAYNESNERIQNYREILSTIPLLDERKILQDFSPFKYFNKELLIQVYGNHGDFLFSFVKEHLMYFQKTANNFYLLPNLQKALETYTAIVNYQCPPSIRTRIEDLWKEKKSSIQNQIKTYENEIEGFIMNMPSLEEKLNTLHEKLKKASRELDRVVRPRTVEVGGSKRKFIAQSVILEILGIVLIYVNIIYSNSFSFVLGSIGVALIIAGFLLSQKKSAPQVETVKGRYTSEVDTMYLEESVDVLKIQIEEVEKKKMSALTSIVRLKNKVQDLENQYNEPYI